jgi:hypothetical protein
MVDPTGMSTPVTHGELREELERLEIHLEQKFEQERAHMATKTDLEIWGGALHMAMKTNFEIWGGALFERLMTELARHVKAIQEAMSTQVSVIDDKFADLPARVSHLETAVFAPKAH